MTLLVKSEHTPGPWFVFQGFASDSMVFAVLPAGRAGVIADKIEDGDDASLIAAAPDLLAALQELAEAESAYRRIHDLHGDGAGVTGRAWDLMRRAGERASAAIAKAEGRAP